MEERVDQLVDYGYADVEIATFHAFGDSLLRGHSLEIGLKNDFSVLSRAEQVIFLRDRLFELPLARYRPLGDPTRHLQAIITLVSRCKDEDISPDDYRRCAAALQAAAAVAAPDDEADARDRAEAQVELAGTYATYRELMAREGNIDFGDQIVLALRLLRERPHVLTYYQRRYGYILVDEFQDTNYAQFELVKLLAARHRNVACVLDDDQAVYRFRGAAISNVVAFLEHYRDTRQVVLTDNFRCPYGAIGFSDFWQRWHISLSSWLREKPIHASLRVFRPSSTLDAIANAVSTPWRLKASRVIAASSASRSEFCTQRCAGFFPGVIYYLMKWFPANPDGTEHWDLCKRIQRERIGMEAVMAKHPPARSRSRVTHVYCGAVPPWDESLGEFRDFTAAEKAAATICNKV